MPKILPIALALLFAAMPTLTATAGLKDRSYSMTSDSFKNLSQSLRFDKEVTEGAERITVRVKLRLEAGSADWRLEDPFGRVRLEGSVEAGEVGDVKEWFTAQDGDWRLVIHLSSATGRYRVRLSTR